jgi:hypothetical protein
VNTPDAQEGKGREGNRKGKEFPTATAAGPVLIHAEHSEKPSKSEAKTASTWASYAEAYRGIYGTDPVRNRTVNGQLSQFVDRVGAADAPQVAAFFLSHPNAYYRSRGHSVGCLLSDAEKLRTEWATKRVTTGTQARQQERTASNPFVGLLQERGHA